jgi:hypothetical protein
VSVVVGGLSVSPAQQKKKNGYIYMCLFIDKLMLIEPVAIIITVVLTIIIIRLKYTSTPMNSAKNMIRKYAVIAWEEFFPIVEI